MTLPRIRTLATTAALLAAAVPFAASTTQAATPADGSVSESSPTTSWTGGPFLVPRPGTADTTCFGPDDPTCDHFALGVEGPGSGFTVTVEVVPDNGVDDLDISVFDEAGNRIAVGATYEDDAVEKVVIADPPDGVYTVSVMPYLVDPLGGEFAGSATLALGSGLGDEHEEFWIDDVPSNCTTSIVAPATIGHAGVTDDGRRVSLDVHFLLDGISVARAQDLADRARVSYGELGVDFNAVYFDETFSAPSAGTVTDLGGGSRGSITIDDLFAASKAHVGGERPPGTDIVFTLTNKEIGEDTDGNGSVDDLGVLGVADCIGGVRYPHTAFGIGEAWAETLDSLPAEQNNASVIILAHEVGHLMGGNHHWGECATGQRPHEANERVDPRHPCTLMFPSAGPNNLPFSPLNGSVVRGHAVSYAD